METTNVRWPTKVTDPDGLRSASSVYYSHADDTLRGPIGTPETYSAARVRQELVFHLLFYKRLFIPSANLVLNPVLGEVLRGMSGGLAGKARLLRAGAIVPTFRDSASSFPELTETLIASKANGLPADLDGLRAYADFLDTSLTSRPVTFESASLFGQFAKRMRAHLANERQMAALQLSNVAPEARERITQRAGGDRAFGTTLFFDLADELQQRDQLGAHRLRQLSSVVRHQVEIEAFDLEAGVAPEFRPADNFVFGAPDRLTMSSARLEPSHDALLEDLREPISKAFDALTEDVLLHVRGEKDFKRFVTEMEGAYSEPDDAVAALRYRRAWQARTLRVWQTLALLGGGQHDRVRQLEEEADRLEGAVMVGDLGSPGLEHLPRLVQWLSFLAPIPLVTGPLSMFLSWKIRGLRQEAEAIRERETGRLLMESAERRYVVNRSSSQRGQ